jgi:hypothetical protein
MVNCAETDCDPKKQLLKDAEFRGKVLESLETLKKSVDELFTVVREDQKSDAKDFKRLWFHVGLLSGGTGLVGGILGAFLEKLILR